MWKLTKMCVSWPCTLTEHYDTFSLMWSSATSIAMPTATLQSTPAVLYTRRLGVRYSSRRHLEEVGREGGRDRKEERQVQCTLGSMHLRG